MYNKTGRDHFWLGGMNGMNNKENPERFLRSSNSPTDTSWAKASEMRNNGSPTARNVTILSTASSRRTPLYLASVGSLSRKSENTYSVATCAIAMACASTNKQYYYYHNNNNNKRKNLPGFKCLAAVMVESSRLSTAWCSHLTSRHTDPQSEPKQRRQAVGVACAPAARWRVQRPCKTYCVTCLRKVFIFKIEGRGCSPENAVLSCHGYISLLLHLSILQQWKKKKKNMKEESTCKLWFRVNNTIIRKKVKATDLYQM